MAKRKRAVLRARDRYTLKDLQAPLVGYTWRQATRLADSNAVFELDGFLYNIGVGLHFNNTAFGIACRRKFVAVKYVNSDVHDIRNRLNQLTGVLTGRRYSIKASSGLLWVYWDLESVARDYFNDSEQFLESLIIQPDAS